MGFALLESSFLPLPVREVMGFIVRSGYVLLGRRLSGRAAGRISGFGGRLLSGEAAESGLIREIEEECGVRCWSPRHLAFLRIFVVDETLHVVDRYAAKVFWVSQYAGEITSSSEMQPFWCRFSEIPYAEMWSSDIHWLPLSLSGQYCTVKIVRDVSTNKSLSTFVATRNIEGSGTGIAAALS